MQVTAWYGLIALVFGTLGLSIGVATSTNSQPASTPPSLPVDKDDENKEDSDLDSETSEMSDAGDLDAVLVNETDDCKLVLIVRTDLGMSAGKVAAQTSHATLACYKTILAINPKLLRRWEHSGGKNVVTYQCSDEDELLLLQAQARSLNLCARTIQDAGRTQIAAGSTTCLGIGPGPSAMIDDITAHLKIF